MRSRTSSGMRFKTILGPRRAHLLIVRALPNIPGGRGLYPPTKRAQCGGDLSDLLDERQGLIARQHGVFEWARLLGHFRRLERHREPLTSLCGFTFRRFAIPPA